MPPLRSLTIALFAAGALCAQTADTLWFRAVMLPANEVPPTPAGPTGSGDIIVHVVRDATGAIVSGSVDFVVRSKFPADVTFTGLHIHNGPAGQNAGVVIPTSLSATNTVQQKGGAVGVVSRTAYVAPDNATALAALRGLVRDPSQYYVNIHTTDYAAGVIRGQLEPARVTVLMGTMSSDNEVPAVSNGVKASGVAQVIAVGTADTTGKVTSGEVFFATTYSLSAAATFSGFHVHPGRPGTAGPVAIGSNLPSGTSAEADTPGLVKVDLPTEIDLGSALQVSAFRGLFESPGDFYVNIHTTANPSGVMRAALRRTGQIGFPVLLDSANETPAATVKATAASQAIAFVLRDESGAVETGTVVFDVNYRFPAGPVNVTGLHIHDGKSGVNGPVTINMIPAVQPGFTSDTGNGNFFAWTAPITGGAALATLSDMVKNPENHYLNLHTTTDAGGVMRGQLAAPVTAPARVQAVISLNQDKNATTVAPGELIAVYGSNLSKVAGTLDGWRGSSLPVALNGTSMTIGGKNARFYYVSPGQVNGVVPVDVTAGRQSVLVDNGNGLGAPFTVTVEDAAPAIFAGAVVRNSDFSYVTSDHPAAADEVVVVYCTGLGVTRPPVGTGDIVPSDLLASTAAVTATVGGQNADVIYSLASPGFAGLYQVALRVPGGLSGSQPLVLAIGNARSAPVTLPVR